MVVRHRKRARHRYMGTARTWGAGNTKRRRGKGSRGGKGMAGMGKHKWATTMNLGVDNYFGKHGFVSKSLPIKECMNLGTIEDMYNAGKIEKKDGKATFVFDGKILSRGNINFPLVLKATAVSKSAKDKVEKAGGTVELLG